MVRFGLAAILALGVAVTGCGDDGGGPGGSGAVGGGGAGGVGPGGAGGGGAGGTGGVLNLSDPLVLEALIDEGLPLVATITDVTVSSPPVLQFAVSTQAGNPVAGVPAGAVSGTFTKLVPPASANEVSNWQSYINNLATAPGAGGAGGGGVQALQASRDDGVIEVEDGDDIVNVTDNGDGTYVFTYTTDVTMVTTPVPISWEQTYTTRAGLEFRINGADVLQPDNPVFDFVPDGSAISEEKLISATSLCNNCHQRLGLHGAPPGARFTEEYCVTCHNTGSRDPETGESIDMAYMIHSIHASAFRDAQDEPYIIIGRGGSVHDYSEVTYPQNVRECENCHNEDDAPQGNAWAENVKALACGGCHVNTEDALGNPRVILRSSPPDPTTGLSTYAMEHVFLQTEPFPDSACRNCHNDVSFPDLVTAERHARPEVAAAANFQYNIVNVTNTNEGQNPQVTFSVTNPNDDSFYDFKYGDEGPFDSESWGGDARLAVMLAWPSEDYTNLDTGSQVAGFRPGSPAQNVSMDPLAGDGDLINEESVCENAATGDGCVNNGDGTYTITSTDAVPSDLPGTTLTAAMEGHPFEDVDPDPIVEERHEIPVTGAVAYYEISDTGGQGDPRREIVSLDKCANCHGELLSLHGSNRTNKIELCVTCHNANATDIGARAEGGVQGEESIDFKRMIHGIHAANVVIYGFGGSVHDYTHVTYPGELNNCGACHVGNSYYPYDPDTNLRIATTFISDNFDNASFPEDVVPTAPRTPQRALTLADQEDDLNRTFNATACLQCHTAARSEQHAVAEGARLSVKQDNAGMLLPIPGDPFLSPVEDCVRCHSEGALVSDVGVRHAPWFPLP
jgi:OmcA/MtrC family decaheme c-type cytochrome